MAMRAAPGQDVDHFVGEYAAEGAAQQEIGMGEIAARHCGADGASHLVAFDLGKGLHVAVAGIGEGKRAAFVDEVGDRFEDAGAFEARHYQDRKSTRLNSSHGYISY